MTTGTEELKFLHPPIPRGPYDMVSVECLGSVEVNHTETVVDLLELESDDVHKILVETVVDVLPRVVNG